MLVCKYDKVANFLLFYRYFERVYFNFLKGKLFRHRCDLIEFLKKFDQNWDHFYYLLFVIWFLFGLLGNEAEGRTHCSEMLMNKWSSLTNIDCLVVLVVVIVLEEEIELF